jgi:hypothetical protein
MWSPTSSRTNRISGPKNFHSSPQKDFCNSIDLLRTNAGVLAEIGPRSPSGDSGVVFGSSSYQGSGVPNGHQWTPQNHLEACPLTN